MITVPNDQVMAAYRRVPRPIREFLSNSEVGPIATTLAQKYRLHVDASGILADIITKTLLGFIPPEQLPQILTEQLLLERTMATALINDINAEVFVPLQQLVRTDAENTKREEELERELDAAAPEEPEDIAPEAPTIPLQREPAKPAPLPPPALQYEPAPQTLPGSSIPAPMPQQAREVLPAIPQSHEVAIPQPVPLPTQPIQVVQTQPQSTHGAPPGWHPAAAVHIFVPSHGGMPTPQQHHAMPAPEPTIGTYQEPPQQAPVAAPVYVQPTPPPTPRIIEVPTQSSRPPQKLPGSDPYREPI